MGLKECKEEILTHPASYYKLVKHEKKLIIHYCHHYLSLLAYLIKLYLSRMQFFVNLLYLYFTLVSCIVRLSKLVVANLI